MAVEQAVDGGERGTVALRTLTYASLNCVNYLSNNIRCGLSRTPPLRHSRRHSRVTSRQVGVGSNHPNPCPTRPWNY
jgi:hypothetical protein